MTNREKYAKEILDIACSGSMVAVKNGVPCGCNAIECSECDLHNGVGCDNNFIKWIKAEYIEPPVDWSKVPIDTPIWVRAQESDNWKRKHFAGLLGDSVKAFFGGGTSWTETNTRDWRYAKLADVDDLDKNSLLRGDGRKEE